MVLYNKLFFVNRVIIAVKCIKCMKQQQNVATAKQDNTLGFVSNSLFSFQNRQTFNL